MKEPLEVASVGEIHPTNEQCELKVIACDVDVARVVAARALASASTSARWSPTNGALACATKSRGVWLYKPDRELSELGAIAEDDDEGKEDVHALDFSPGSRFLCAGGSARGEEVAVWDLRRRKKHRVLAGHNSAVRTVRYGQFGRVIGSGSDSGVVLVHDVESARRVALAPPTLSGVTSIDFSKYSPQHVVSACVDGTVRLWDAEAGQLQSTLTVRGSECYQVEFSPTVPGLLGYVKGDGRVVLQDITSPTPSGALTFKDCQVTTMCWHYSGYALAVGTSDGRIVWLDSRKISGGADVATCQIYAIKAHDGAVKALSWQHPVPRSFQVEKTPSRGENIPESPMTPVAAKSSGLLHERAAPAPALAPAPAPLPIALPRNVANVNAQQPGVGTSELAAIIERRQRSWETPCALKCAICTLNYCVSTSQRWMKLRACLTRCVKSSSIWRKK